MQPRKILGVFFGAMGLIALVGGGSVVMASHATHFVSEKGPALAQDENGCYICHADGTLQCGEEAPFFRSGTDGDGDSNFNLAETDVCDFCHSPNGAYDGVTSSGSSVGAKDNWAVGVYELDGKLQAGKERWCAGCHDDQPANSEYNGSGVDAPMVAGDDSTFGFYATGHGKSVIPLRGTAGWPTERIECLDCHDAGVAHIDGEARTYSFDNASAGSTQSGVDYAAGYRLGYVGGEVPLRIPANYSTTFGYNGLLIRDTAFRLCLYCHDTSRIFDNTPGDGIDSNFKASLPNPPRDYSYAWGSGADTNEHVNHMMNYTMEAWDSDWDIDTNGPGPGPGTDSMTACSSCHNVHGPTGVEGSTNEAMLRDGSLAGRAPGYGFSYVIEDSGAGGYPWVTSDGATQSTSVGAIFRYNTEINNMCSGVYCHGNPVPPAGSGYDASGSSWETYIEYYRPWNDTHSALSTERCWDLCHSMD
ncbi:MAG: hypothetical protein JRI70_10310 [Deltaproteobacteria bacterium]|nr:hypothetical protein [Deltaproteobacteria bacterium]